MEKNLERQNTERVQRSTVFPSHSHDCSWSKSSSHTATICVFLRMGFFFSFNFWTRKSFTSFNLRSVSGLITPLDTKYRRTWEVWALKKSFSQASTTAAFLVTGFSLRFNFFIRYWLTCFNASSVFAPINPISRKKSRTCKVWNLKLFANSKCVVYNRRIHSVMW